MTNAHPGRVSRVNPLSCFRDWAFVIDSSFVIRYSSFKASIAQLIPARLLTLSSPTFAPSPQVRDTRWWPAAPAKGRAGTEAKSEADAAGTNEDVQKPPHRPRDVDVRVLRRDVLRRVRRGHGDKVQPVRVLPAVRGPVRRGRRAGGARETVLLCPPPGSLRLSLEEERSADSPPGRCVLSHPASHRDRPGGSSESLPADTCAPT